MSTDLVTEIFPFTVDNYTAFNTGTNLLTFGDALQFFQESSNGTAYLFTDGCGHDQDCTAACLDVNSAFSNAETLQNCMQYPLIARNLDNLDSPSLFLAQEMGITNGNNATDVYNVVSRCLISYFDAASSLPGSPRSGRAPCVNRGGADNSVPCYLDLCNPTWLYAPLNADIGGTGVYISYYMQIGLAIAIYVGIKVCKSWTFWVCRTAFMLAGKQRAKEWARKAQREAAEQLDALVTATVEFHKAQCIFMLAVQVAALIVLHKNNLLETSSLQQIYNDYYLIGAIAIGGFLLITFTLACLHIADLRSWYLYWLSGATIAVSLSTLYVSKTFTPRPQDVGSAPVPSAKCGTANPVKFCLSKNEGVIARWSLFSAPGEVGGAGNSILVFSLIIYALLGVDLFLHTFSRFEKRVRRVADKAIHSKRVSSFKSVRSNLSKHLPGHLETFRFLQLILWLIYVSAVAAYMFFFYKYIINLRAPLTFVSTGNWTFGQIIAITIWTPALFEFFYLETRGMKKGFKYKMPKGWKLVERENKEAKLLDEDAPSHISEFMQHPWATMLGIDLSPPKGNHSDDHELVGTKSYQSVPNSLAPSHTLPPIESMDNQIRGAWEEGDHGPAESDERLGD